MSNEEIELIQDLSGIIGNNPRAIKRFVNVYQIVRAHAGLNFKKGNQYQVYLVLMFLLALPIGPFNKIHRLFVDSINNDDNHGLTLYHFIQSSLKIKDNDMKNMVHKLDVLLSDKETFKSLQKTLLSDFNYHNVFIQRFTFTDIK